MNSFRKKIMLGPGQNSVKFAINLASKLCKAKELVLYTCVAAFNDSKGMFAAA